MNDTFNMRDLFPWCYGPFAERIPGAQPPVGTMPWLLESSLSVNATADSIVLRLVGGAGELSADSSVSPP